MKKFYKDYEKLQNTNDKLQIENKHLYIRATIAEDEEAILENMVSKQEYK